MEPWSQTKPNLMEQLFSLPNCNVKEDTLYMDVSVGERESWSEVKLGES